MLLLSHLYFSTLIYKCRSFDQTTEIIKMMDSKDIKPIMTTFKSLLSKCTNVNQIDQVISTMKERELIADSSITEMIERKMKDFQ